MRVAAVPLAANRIALIGPSAPFRGGIAQYNDHLADALTAHGANVERLSFSRLYPQLLFPGRTQYRAESVAQSAAARPMLDSLRPATWRATADAVRADVALFQRRHPFFAPALATIAARLARRGVPSVFICHNLEPHERVPGGALVSHLALRRAAAFVTTSELDAARLRVRYPARPVVVVVPPPTPAPPCQHGDDRAGCERALGLPPARRRALFFGYVREYKGLPTLIAALAEAPADLQLVVAGEIYHRTDAYYRGLAREAGVGDRVVLLDRFLPDSEVSCCFRAADLVVLPYWQASQSAVAPLAMGYGRAVVASAVGGIPEVIEDGVTGALVPPRDARALAAAIRRALEHAEWGAAAATAALRYSWPRAAATITELAGSI